MNRHPAPNDDSWEHDPVWKLLDQTAPASASPRFAENVVRAARLAGQPAPWWRRWPVTAPLAGLAATAAAVVFGLLSLGPDAPDASGAVTASNDFAEIQELAESEILLTAVDHLDAFSDTELVNLIGF
jgi:hypothetical protein